MRQQICMKNGIFRFYRRGGNLAEIFLVDCVHAYPRHDCSSIVADLDDVKYLILLRQILNISNCGSVLG